MTLPRTLSAGCGFSAAMLAALFFSLSAPPPANAADESLDARVARLEQEINRREIDGNLQEIFLKITQIERSLREVTGLAEDGERVARQLTRQFEKFAADVEDRLAIIEERLRESIPDTDAGAAGKDGPPGDAEALYQYALEQFLAKKNYREAAESFESFLDRFPGHAKADSIHYWLGELYYVQKNYKRSAQYYLEGYRAHAQGSKAMDNLFKLGLSLVALGQNEESCSIFSELSANFPNAPARITRIVERERRQIPCA